MTKAGHFPTMTFQLSVWQAMRVWKPEHAYNWPGDGFYRFQMNGKPMVGYCAPVDSGEVSFAVRPIVRVPMGKA